MDRRLLILGLIAAAATGCSPSNAFSEDPPTGAAPTVVPAASGTVVEQEQATTTTIQPFDSEFWDAVEVWEPVLEELAKLELSEDNRFKRSGTVWTHLYDDDHWNNFSEPFQSAGSVNSPFSLTNRALYNWDEGDDFVRGLALDLHRLPGYEICTGEPQTLIFSLEEYPEGVWGARSRYNFNIDGQAVQMVEDPDEIVWVMHPRGASLSSSIEAFASELPRMLAELRYTELGCTGFGDQRRDQSIVPQPDTTTTTTTPSVTAAL